MQAQISRLASPNAMVLRLAVYVANVMLSNRIKLNSWVPMSIEFDKIVGKTPTVFIIREVGFDST